MSLDDQALKAAVEPDLTIRTMRAGMDAHYTTVSKHLTSINKDEEVAEFGSVEDQQRIHHDDFLLDQVKSVYQELGGMNVEQVFNLVSSTKSKICFINGETQEILFNNQLRIHPFAVSQLIHNSPGTTTRSDAKNECEVAKNDLEVVLRITQRYDTSEIREKKYRASINGVLQKHRMITEAEISVVWKGIMKQINLSGKQKEMFENMRPTVAFRVRTVMMGARLGDLAAAMKIALCVGGEDVACNPIEIANCVEISKLNFSRKWKEHVLALTKGEEIFNMDAKQRRQAIRCFRRKLFDLSDEDVATIDNRKVSRKTKMKLLAMRCADGVINNEQRRAEVVKHINEGISLAVQYEKGPLPFSSPLSCYYHVEKHGIDTVPAFYFEAKIDVPENPWSRENIFKIYFEEMPKYLFTKENYRSTIVSQDGKTVTRTWATRMGYVGYTKAPYVPTPNVDLSSNPSFFLPGETIATHFQKDKHDVVYNMLLDFLPREYEYGNHGLGPHGLYGAGAQSVIESRTSLSYHVANRHHNSVYCVCCGISGKRLRLVVAEYPNRSTLDLIELYTMGELFPGLIDMSHIMLLKAVFEKRSTKNLHEGSKEYKLIRALNAEYRILLDTHINCRSLQKCRS